MFVNFTAGTHGSILDPTCGVPAGGTPEPLCAAATAEMQTEAVGVRAHRRHAAAGRRPARRSSSPRREPGTSGGRYGRPFCFRRYNARPMFRRRPEEPAHGQRAPGFLTRLRRRLNRGNSWLTYDLADLFRGRQIDAEILDELETRLLTADVGVEATEHILDGPARDASPATSSTTSRR